MQRLVFKHSEHKFKEYSLPQRRELLENLDTLEAVIHRVVNTYGVLRMKENELNALKENGISKSSLIEPENNNAFSKSEIETQMQRQEEKVNMREAVDAGLVVTESSGTKPDKQDTSSSSGNYTTAWMQISTSTTKSHLLSYDTHLLETIDSNTTPTSTNMCHRGGEIDQDALLKTELLKTKDMEFPEFREFFVINDLKAQLLARTTLICNLKKQIKSVKETSNEAKVKNNIDVIETINIELEHSVAKLLAANEQLHKENEHLKQTYKELYDSIKKTRIQNKDNSESLISQINQKSVENADLKAQIQEKVFANAALNNELRKLKGNIVDSKNHLVVRQPNAFTSERPRISRPRFASQVDEKNDLSKTVTPHYLPKVRESAAAKPHQDMASTRAHCTPNACTPKPRNIYRSSPVSKCSGGMSNGKPLVDHSRNSSFFLDSKQFVCLICHKYIFNTNHDDCITKILNKVNSRAKVQSPKIKNNNPVEPKNHTHKPGRQNGIGQRFSLNKSSAVHEKPHTPRSCLRWKPTGRIFKTVSLRWIPTGKMFTDSTTKVDSEPPNGSNDDITNPYECNQTLYEFKEFKSDEHASNDVWTKQFKPRSSSKDVWIKRFKPRSLMSNLLASLQALFLKVKKGVRLPDENVTPHYLPKVRESAAAKPHQVNAPNYSRNSHKESYGSNDMVHAYFLEDARKMTQDKTRIPSHKDMASTRAHCTPNACTPKPRNIYRSSPVSKCSGGMSNGEPLVDHSRNSSFFLDSKQFVCSICHKYIFNTNHDDCITKILNKVNSRAKVQSPKIRNNNPVEPKNHTHKPGRQNGIGQRFSLNKSSAVHEKPHTPRSYLRWKPTGRIFKTVSLRWIPTGKVFIDSTTKVDSEPPNGSNDDITNPYECNQTLYVSAGTSNSSAGTSVNPLKERLRGIHCISKFPSIYIQLFWNTLTHDAKTGRSLLHDNIVPKPDLALELGKSISLTEAEEEAVAREVHATHARIVSGPDPEPMQEDQTGSNSGKLHVSLAGPNPEHMDDEFLATAYPKVHENLKLITDERVIEENPESHSGSMSSMKNLDDTYNFGDQFLYDKPTEDDQEKSKVIEESDSTIPDPSHQTVTSTPPVIAPFTDVSSTKPSSLVTPPPINTEATTITTSLPEITPFIALQLRVARLEQEMSEVKKTDHSADVLASIKSQVPTVVDKYLGTKLDDALLKILERHTADLIEKYSVLPGPESIQNQESEKSPKEIIRIKRDKPTQRRQSGIAFRDSFIVSKKRSSDSSKKLKGIQTLTPAKQEAADIMKALKESKKMSKRQPGTRGSNEGTSNI
ncbi:hypothetical protein Tco_1042851 [Tanacetum coccineum]|uniref:Uncharacterized protein n=1 Tax=Tanacetum coccineum TaxID=301880 RepID=A0ABQ5GKB4_9ASTR